MNSNNRWLKIRFRRIGGISVAWSLELFCVIDINNGGRLLLEVTLEKNFRELIRVWIHTLVFAQSQAVSDDIE